MKKKQFFHYNFAHVHIFFWRNLDIKKKIMILLDSKNIEKNDKEMNSLLVSCVRGK